MTQELLPCPFCGGTKLVLHACDENAICCFGCGVRGPQGAGDWNRRAPQWQPISDYQRQEWAAFAFHAKNGLWYRADNAKHATHWMPLPAPSEVA